MTKTFCLKLFLFFQYLYLNKRYRYRQHRRMTQFRLMVNHLYILGKGAALKPRGTPQFISPASEMTSFSEIWLKRFNDWLLKTIHSIFCKSMYVRGSSFWICISEDIIWCKDLEPSNNVERNANTTEEFSTLSMAVSHHLCSRYKMRWKMNLNDLFEIIANCYQSKKARRIQL